MASLLVVVLVVVGGALYLARSEDGRVPRISASDDATARAALVSSSGAGGSQDPAWTTGASPVGSWVQLEWDGPTAVDRITLQPAEGLAAPTGGLLTFDGGAAVFVASGADGSAEVSFPQRRATTVRYTVATTADPGVAVALSRLRVDDAAGAAPAGSATAAPAVTASSSAGGTSAAAVADGDLADGGTGEEWRAADDDRAPWVQLTWDAPRTVSAVQLFGPSQTMSDPAAGGAAPLHGELRFSDGSSVVVSGLDAGDGQPTTVAVAPRTVTSVRVELAAGFPSARAALREVAVYGVGETPVRWPAPGPSYEVTPPAASCGGAPVGSAPAGSLALVCPAVGSAVGDSSPLQVQAEPGATVQAVTGVTPPGSSEVVPLALGSAVADGSGRASLDLDLAQVPAGPFAVEVTQASGSQEPLHVQLVRDGEPRSTDGGHAPPGMTPQFEEQFDEPLSASATGSGAEFAALKPEAWGGSQFGEAVFADPALGAGTVATIPGGFLRVRAQPIGDLPVPRPYGQQHAGGIVSSARVGAGGFSAQYGYFEARMLAGAGAGSWPAFWMLNTQGATSDNATGGEVDAVELYGHDTSSTCHTLHDWGAPGDDGSSGSRCVEPEGLADWSLGWHDYGVRVTPDGATFFIDGVQVADERGLGRSSEPFYFLVDMALGGGWPVALDPTGGTTDLYVDWVRVST